MKKKEKEIIAKKFQAALKKQGIDLAELEKDMKAGEEYRKKNALRIQSVTSRREEF